LTVKHRYSALHIGIFLTGLIFTFSSCRKINEATELGGGLIPAVDNITTFDTTLTVEAYNGIFDLSNDSLRLSRNEEHWLGKITNDPLFGKTDARLFFELKPPFYKYFFIANKANMRLDSVVMILDYVETYGDTNALQTVNVYEIDPNDNTFKRDSAYLIRVNNIQKGPLLGSRTFAPSILNDSVKSFMDSSGVNQLRIRLDNSFGTRLLNFDSTGLIGPNAAFVSDSLFRTNFKGFVVESTTGNAVMGIDLNGANTRLGLYFRYDKGTVIDTPAVAYFGFTSFSASANHIIRDYSGTPVQNVQGGTNPDDLVYIQTAPGTFATLKIPGLAGMSNRLVHRAELIAEQVYNGPTDSTFNAPTYLYLDASDPSITTEPKFRTIPYDLVFNSAGGLNITQFGMSPQRGFDAAMNPIKIWKFNLTRYVQHVLTGTDPLYDLRLFAPFFYTEKFRPPGSTTDVSPLLIVNPSIVKGRVRLAGGTPAAGPQRMRLRIIYSKL
jgi:hypothetical protein